MELVKSPWSADVATCLKKSKVTEENGLNADEANSRRNKFGANELSEEEARSFLEMILEQFDDPLVKILLVAALISTVLAVNESISVAGYSILNLINPSEMAEAASVIYGQLTIERFVEPLVILCILFLNAAVGVWQESNAEKSLEALKKMQPAIASVLREGKWQHDLPARELVPGDIIRLINLKTTIIRTEEMALTGESATVLKDVDVIPSRTKGEIEIQGRKNMFFSGTSISIGAAIKFNLEKFSSGNKNQYLTNPSKFVEVESQLVHVGVAGLRDPPRQEVAQAVKDCSNAGISVVVITGNNKKTAEAICRDIGVFEATQDVSSVSFPGSEFSELSKEEQLSKLYMFFSNMNILNRFFIFFSHFVFSLFFTQLCKSFLFLLSQLKGFQEFLVSPFQNAKQEAILGEHISSSDVNRRFISSTTVCFLLQAKRTG